MNPKKTLNWISLYKTLEVLWHQSPLCKNVGITAFDKILCRVAPFALLNWRAWLGLFALFLTVGAIVCVGREAFGAQGYASGMTFIEHHVQPDAHHGRLETMGASGWASAS